MDKAEKQNAESEPDLEIDQNEESKKLANNNTVPKSDEQENYEDDEDEQDDDDISIDLSNDESTMECETEILSAEDREHLQDWMQQITKDYGDEYNMELSALQALEESTEAFVVGLFEDANNFAERQGRVTVKAEDIASVNLRRMGIDPHRGEDTPPQPPKKKQRK